MIGWIGKGIAIMIGFKLVGIIAFISLVILAAIGFGIYLLVDCVKTRREKKKKRRG